MGHDEPRQTREGRLIEAAAKATGQSVKKLAANAGMSDTRWRHIVRGWQPAPGGGQNEVVAPASTLARMAFVVGVSPELLIESGRSDAADLLTRLDVTGVDVNVPAPGMVAVRAFIPATADQTDEIDLVYASKSMTAEQKLKAIRQILLLRKQRDAELAAMLEVPAADAESQTEQQS